MLPKKLRYWRYAVFYGLLLNRRFPLLTLGETKTECAWTFCPTGINAQSVVYSGGVGNDVTFEQALISRFGCTVVMFDPSPTGLETMARPENKNQHIRFHAVALAGRNGTLRFAPPLNAAEGSWYAREDGTAQIEVPCTDLTSLMRANGHDKIDLLKLDIEGSEYEVIEHILEHRIPVRQICVEYHHGMLPGIRRSQTIRSMLKLVRRGYKLLYQVGNNHTFLLPGPADRHAEASTQNKV